FSARECSHNLPKRDQEILGAQNGELLRKVSRRDGKPPRVAGEVGDSMVHKDQRSIIVMATQPPRDAWQRHRDGASAWSRFDNIPLTTVAAVRSRSTTPISRKRRA